MKFLLSFLAIFGLGMGSLMSQVPFSTQAADKPVSLIQIVRLDASKPIYVPVHHRVTTTVRFPDVIAAPEGNGFVEDTANVLGEYVVSWVKGEKHFTVTPVEGAGARNLNVTLGDQTYVLYFIPVDKQFQAVALLNVILAEVRPDMQPRESGRESARGREAQADMRPRREDISRQTVPPPEPFTQATPSRLLGFMDKLKVLYTTKIGPELASMSQSMRCEVVGTSADANATEGGLGLSGFIEHARMDGGLYELILIRVVRDTRLNCIGFALLLRNTSEYPIAFDTTAFSARLGDKYYQQAMADMPAILNPGEDRIGFFIIRGSRSEPELAANDWRVNASLISPRLNPGAAISASIAKEKARAKEATQ